MTEVDSIVDFGFALDEYTVQRHGPLPGVKGGTICKATHVPGGFHDALFTGNRAPGPGYYFKDGKRTDKIKGGRFSKLPRDTGKRAHSSGPSVGQYNVVLPDKPRGGIMNKHDRVCAFARMAERLNQWNSNGPGKYNPEPPPKHTAVPMLAAHKSEPKQPKRTTPVGPGYYNPNYVHIDTRVPAYSTPKEDIDSYMNRISNQSWRKDNFPGYKDMPEAKGHDKGGTLKHCRRLLKDRDLPPRRKSSAAAARSRRYSATPDLARVSRLSDEIPERPASEIPRLPSRAESTTPRPGCETPRPLSETPRPPSVPPRPPSVTPRPPSTTPRPTSALDN